MNYAHRFYEHRPSQAVFDSIARSPTTFTFPSAGCNRIDIQAVFDSSNGFASEPPVDLILDVSNLSLSKQPAVTDLLYGPLDCNTLQGDPTATREIQAIYALTTTSGGASPFINDAHRSCFVALFQEGVAEITSQTFPSATFESPAVILYVTFKI